jgi:hypothetical protein
MWQWCSGGDTGGSVPPWSKGRSPGARKQAPERLEAAEGEKVCAEAGRQAGRQLAWGGRRSPVGHRVHAASVERHIKLPGAIAQEFP